MVSSLIFSQIFLHEYLGLHVMETFYSHTDDDILEPFH